MPNFSENGTPMTDIDTNILVVDDIRTNRSLLNSLLSSPGRNIIEASSGRQTLRLLTQHDFALILLDVQMPEMDGYETAGLIRSNPATRNIPIIFVTSINKTQAHMFKGYKHGAVDYLFKPLKATVLRNKVNIFCELYQQRRLIEQQVHKLEDKQDTLEHEMRERRQAEEKRRTLQKHVRQMETLESLGTLAGGIAHDFNNILMGISASADSALQELSKNSPVQHHIQEVRSSTARAAALVKQMLAYSGNTQVILHELSPARTVRESCRLFEIPGKKEITVHYEMGSDLPPIRSEQFQLRQVLSALFSNAIDAIEDKPGTITISVGLCKYGTDALAAHYLGNRLEGGAYVAVKLRDTGRGMDRETVSRIFEPFFSTKSTGRGLGLAAVLGIVRSHGAAIGVTSEVGKGTCFTILFPPATDAAPTRKETEEKPDTSNEAGHILVVDDEPIVRKIACRLLEKLEFTPLKAAEGEQGLELLREKSDEIATVAVDLSLPCMKDGSFIEQVRSIRRDISILIMSGRSKLEMKNACKGQKIDAFVQKPFSMSTLRKVLNKVQQ